MRRLPPVEPLLVGALLASTLVLGIALRLEGPLSTRALGAEDPYTHVVFTKEWLATGSFGDSFHLGTSMYPPGMHAFVGAFAPIAGVSLYDFARIAPALFGGLAILGMFALGHRLGGNVAGLGAAFITAIIPEHIFRTELLFPTALDLALLPLWLMAFHMAITTHRVQGSALFLGASVPLAIMHPWLVPLFALPLAIYAALRAIRGKIEPRALNLGAALLVPAVAFAMAFRWDDSDTGFADFLAAFAPLRFLDTLQLPGPVLFVALLALLGAAAALALGLAHLALRVRLPRPVRFVVGALVAVGLLASLPLLTRELPPAVNYHHMLGKLAMGLALAGLALAFLRPTPLGDLAVAICVPLFPLTAVNLFDSEFWPQRTVAYLAFGVALLGASALALAHEVPLRFRAPRLERHRASASVALIAILALAVAGTATATYKPVWDWYRIYEDEHFAGFEHVAGVLDADPAAKVFVYGWQAGLMVKTLADPAQVWYAPKLYQMEDERQKRLDQLPGAGYIIVDRFTLDAAKKGKADLAFLEDGSRYRLLEEWVDEDADVLRLYEVVR